MNIIQKIITKLFRLLGIWTDPANLKHGQQYQFPLTPRDWSFLYSNSQLYVENNQLSFNFAPAPGKVGYLYAYADGISGSRVEFDYTVSVTAGDPVFDYRTAENNQNGPGYPCKIRLFIQRKGDNFSAAGEYQQYRYWSTQGVAELKPGTGKIVVDFNPENWTDVYSKKGSEFPDRFAAALANAQGIGITFGGGSFYGHGVMIRNGAAKFIINRLSICN